MEDYKVKKRSRRSKATSKKSKEQLERMLAEARKGIMKALESLTTKLNKGKVLRDEEFRFLKKAPDIVSYLEEREKAHDNERDEGLPEGRLREFVEMEWRLSEICKDRDQVIEATGYYRCLECGETHKKAEPCMYKQFQNITKSANESKELEEDNAV